MTAPDAEGLEIQLDDLVGRDGLVAHLLEAAYFYPPDAPKEARLVRELDRWESAPRA